MKLEKGSFTPTSDITTVVLNDDTLTPDRIVLWVEGTYPSHGYDDMTRQVAAYASTSEKNDRSIYVHNGSSATMSGRVTAMSAGEFDITYDVRTATQTNFLAIED